MSSCGAFSRKMVDTILILVKLRSSNCVSPLDSAGTPNIFELTKAGAG